MSKQQISAIYNNTTHEIYVTHSSKSETIKLVETLKPKLHGGGESPFVREGVLHVPPNTWCRVECNIPAYENKADGAVWLALSGSDLPQQHPTDGLNALLLWKVKIEGQTGITFVNGKSMKGIYHMNFEKEEDNYFALFFETVKNADGKDELDVILELRSSNGIKQWLINVMKQRAVEHHEEMQELRQEAGKAIIALL